MEIGEHRFTLYLHLPAVRQVRQQNGGGFHITGPFEVELAFDSNLALSCSHEPCFIARTYGGASETGSGLRISGADALPCFIATTLARV